MISKENVLSVILALALLFVLMAINELIVFDKRASDRMQAIESRSRQLELEIDWYRIEFIKMREAIELSNAIK